MKIDPNDPVAADTSTRSALAQPPSTPQPNDARRRGLAFWPFAPAKRRQQRIAEAIYRVIVAHSRRPVFYTSYGLADTPDNRREWIGCHAALAMIRLHRCGSEGGRIAQALFDWMFADVEQNFREEGVSDMSIGKHVRRASITFLARYKTIEASLEHGDLAGLADALARNMELRSASDAVDLAACLARAMGDLEALSDEHVMAGRVGLAPPG